MPYSVNAMEATSHAHVHTEIDQGCDIYGYSNPIELAVVITYVIKLPEQGVCIANPPTVYVDCVIINTHA